MKVTLWGVRGSLPTPMHIGEYRNKLLSILRRSEKRLKDSSVAINTIVEELPEELLGLVGGETTCVEVTCDGHRLVLDLGTGSRKLGYHIHDQGSGGVVNVLLTHTHWDHIQGWPYFEPAFDPNNAIHFYSCIEDLEDRFVGQQTSGYSQQAFHDTPSRKEFHYIEPCGVFDIGPFHITTQPLLHPGGSISYKIEAKGKTFIFATDTEFYGPDLSELILQYKEFFHDADLMMMDAQYSLQEAEQKKGWGHTAMTIAVDCCIHWKIKQLILTHHEPAHSDEKIYELYEKAYIYLEQSNPSKQDLKIHLAREGDSYTL